MRMFACVYVRYVAQPTYSVVAVVVVVGVFVFVDVVCLSLLRL